MLIILPTRDSATQVFEEIVRLVAHISTSCGMLGGPPYREMEREIKEGGHDMVVPTPGLPKITGITAEIADARLGLFTFTPKTYSSLLAKGSYSNLRKVVKLLFELLVRLEFDYNCSYTFYLKITSSSHALLDLLSTCPYRHNGSFEDLFSRVMSSVDD